MTEAINTRREAKNATPPDVIALVIAARGALETEELTESAALWQAVEAFSSRVCYDDEGGSLPDAHADPCTCNPISAFLAECTTASIGARTSAFDLYNAYATWCAREKLHKLSTKSFRAALYHQGMKTRMINNRVQWLDLLIFPATVPPISSNPEGAAWAWMDATWTDHPTDRAFAADEMVDAYIAGANTRRATPEATPQTSDGSGPGSWVPAEQLVQANERIAELVGALKKIEAEYANQDIPHSLFRIHAYGTALAALRAKGWAA